MRRWEPQRANEIAPPASLDLAAMSPRDLNFCSEFAVHGGLAASEQGFRAETELIRMQRAGMLVLQRDPAPPFGVLGVGLSPAMRDLLENTVRDAPTAMPPPPLPPPSPPQRSDLAARRNAFEVARGMICAAVKAEFSALADPATLEHRVLTRIGALRTPFEP